MDNFLYSGKAVFEENSREGTMFFSNGFPAGLRVLLVDDDTTCLSVLEKMLQTCRYEVTKCERGTEALSMLREDKNRFDIIVIDLNMPEMDGIQLLKIIRSEMDLPVVIMSADDERELVLKGVLQGACDYLIKPVKMEALKVLWQHVVRKKISNTSEILEQPGIKEEDKLHLENFCTVDCAVSGDAVHNMTLKRKIDCEDEGKTSDDSTKGKKRMVWTSELHEKFVRAVNHLGPGKAVPNKILECMQRMNVSGLTRENIASHLQKYRFYLRKQADTPHHELEHHYAASSVPGTSIFKQSPSSGGCNLQPRATSCQFPAQNLTTPPSSGPLMLNSSSSMLSYDDQRNLPNYRMPESSYYSLTRSSPLDFLLNCTSLVDASCQNEYSIGHPLLIEDYRTQRNFDQHSQSLPDCNFYEIKAYTKPQMTYDSLFCLQHLDQSEILHEPFLEHLEPLDRL